METRQPPVPVATVILTAGASRRFGPEGPKATRTVEGKTLIERIAGTARAAGCAPVLAVTGPHDWEIRSARPEGIDEWVSNPDWENGRTGTVRIGLGRLPVGSAALVWPVDVPFVAGETVATLARWARRESLAVWLTPTFGGRGGHPIALTPSGVSLVRRLPPALPLRDAPFRQGLGERRIPVDDPAVLDNTNYPWELAAAERAWREHGGDR